MAHAITLILHLFAPHEGRPLLVATGIVRLDPKTCWGGLLHPPQMLHVAAVPHHRANTDQLALDVRRERHLHGAPTGRPLRHRVPTTAHTIFNQIVRKLLFQHTLHALHGGTQLHDPTPQLPETAGLLLGVYTYKQKKKKKNKSGFSTNNTQREQNIFYERFSTNNGVNLRDANRTPLLTPHPTIQRTLTPTP